MIEELAGVGFTLAQVYISQVISSTESLCQIAGIERPKPLMIRQSNSRRVGSSQFTQIEVIWDVANYYKHKDEWQGKSWRHIERSQSRVDKQRAKTIQVLRAIGCEEHCTGNFRRAAEALGMANYELGQLAEILEAWHAKLREVYEEQLKHLKLALEET